jgi:CRISPR-associated endonuclease/helicase Cas3
LDVAAVARHLAIEHISPAAKRHLLGLIPGNEDASLRLLLFVIALHDLGKYTPAFQAKVEWARLLLIAAGFDVDPPTGARHHGTAGLPFIQDALTSVGFPAVQARALARAVAAHHGEFPTNDVLTRERMGGRERGVSPRWEQARSEALDSLRRLFNVNGIDVAAVSAIDHAYVMRLAGLTSVADWIGSMESVFRYEPPQLSLEGYWRLALKRASTALSLLGFRPPPQPVDWRFSSLFPALSPWPLHRAAENVAGNLSAPTLIIIEAPMGEGKTEAALLLAQAAAGRLDQHGFYVGLPTRATANQMFGRMVAFLNRVSPDVRSNMVLAHGDADGIETFRSIVSVHDDGPERLGGVRAEEWFLPKKRALLAEYGVGTIDQALLGVLRTRHGFVRLFGLSGKAVVLDEVHAYDSFTSEILDRLLEWLAAMGTTVVLLSATLPASRRRDLLAAYRRGLGEATTVAPPAGYPRITIGSRDGCSAEHVAPRGRPLTIALQRIDPDIDGIARMLINELHHGGCAGWICNTVDRAQAACEAVARLAPDLPRLLLHARMLPRHRHELEQRVEHRLGPESRGAQRPDRLLVIGTQVIEQSLDIDFDLLVTDLAPVDLILQRAGRLHRHGDRTNRSPAHPQPRLWIAYASGPADSVPIGEVAVVYADALVRATIMALDGRDRVVLPDDIESLVEQVYRAAPPPGDDALFGSYIDYFGGAVAKRQNAAMKVIPRPKDPDDIFGHLRMPLGDDDDPQVHEELRAITRDTEPSVRVVCLVGRNGKVFASEDDQTPLDIDSVPNRALAAALTKRTISVSRPGLVEALLTSSVFFPVSWKDVPLLRYRRLVVFTDAVAFVAGYRMELHPERGLLISKAQASSAA